MQAPLGSPNLILIPTELERQRLLDAGGFEPGSGLVRLCGFGPIAAAARTAQLLGTLKPARVILLGIAGAYDTERYAVGSAFSFAQVAVDGIGVGEGRELIAPPALGFPQWPGSADSKEGPKHPIVDRIPLDDPANSSESPEQAALLLSTCAASASPEQAAVRRERFPEACAEDMEGFGVASACRMHGTPIAIVRGISNRVGDRDASHWRIPAALLAARELTQKLLASSNS